MIDGESIYFYGLEWKKPSLYRYVLINDTDTGVSCRRKDESEKVDKSVRARERMYRKGVETRHDSGESSSSWTYCDYVPKHNLNRHIAHWRYWKMGDFMRSKLSLIM